MVQLQINSMNDWFNLTEINCLKDCCQVSNVAFSTPISITSFGLCFSSSEIPIIIVPPTEFAKAIISFTKLFLLFLLID